MQYSALRAILTIIGSFFSPSYTNSNNLYNGNVSLMSLMPPLFTHRQPAFTVADNQRCLKSKHLLATIKEDTDRALIKLSKAQQSAYLLRLEIPALEVRVPD
jgi:hypothetical protein